MFVFSSKPVVKIYDFVVEGLWKIAMWLLARCFDLLAFIHKPVSAITKFTIAHISAIAEKNNSADDNSVVVKDVSDIKDVSEEEK